MDVSGDDVLEFLNGVANALNESYPADLIGAALQNIIDAII